MLLPFLLGWAVRDPATGLLRRDLLIPILFWHVLGPFGLRGRIRAEARTELYSSAFPRNKSGVRRDSPSLRLCESPQRGGAESRPMRVAIPLAGGASRTVLMCLFVPLSE